MGRHLRRNRARRRRELGLPSIWLGRRIQVYGDGYPLAVRLRSPLIDLGNGKNLNSVEWQAQTPLGTHIEIRSRTGNDIVEQYTFHDKNGKEVTQRRYDKLIPSFKGKIDTTRIPGADWSPWSNIYSASGAAFQSPSPRRFMELDVRLVSDSPTQAPRFDWLAVNFSDPLASEVIGEVFPLQVEPGQETLFSYFLRPSTTQDGFDRIAIEATTVPRFDAAFVDGESVEVTIEVLDQGFRATFPRRIRSRQLVELRFTAPVYLQATRFDAFLEDSQKAQVRQLVDPGDAAPQVESSSNVVRLPIADPTLCRPLVQLCARYAQRRRDQRPTPHLLRPHQRTIRPPLALAAL